LIVDDDALVLTVAERALRSMGFNTITSRAAEEAYSIAASFVPHECARKMFAAEIQPAKP